MRQCRALKFSLEKRFDQNIRTYHPIIPWLVRHAGWAIGRFLVKPSGRTPYETLNNERYMGTFASLEKLFGYGAVVILSTIHL